MADAAGTTHDITIDGIGFLTVPNTLRKFDITPFSPKTRTDNPKYSDFSLAQFFVTESWHHGRGALEYENPFAFYDSANVDTRVRGQITLCPLQNLTTKAAAASVNGNPVKFGLMTTSANLIVATGGASRDVFQWDNTNGDWDPETSGIAADPTDIMEFRGVIHIATGEANNMRAKSGGSWGDGGVPAVFLAQFGNMVLYRSDNVNEIYYTTTQNPTSADWTGPIYVGDTNTNIRALAVGDGKLFVGKDDGLYYIQDQQAYQLLDFSFARDPNNFRNMKWWQGALYFPILNGLYRLIGTTLQAVGPNLGAAGAVEIGAGDEYTMKSLASGKRGRIVDLVPTDTFLYAVVDAGTTGFSGTSQILAYNGSGWHQIVQGAAADKRIRAAFFTGALATTGQFANPRLWYGYDVDVYNIILPLGTDDPFEYASETYQASGTLDFPGFDAGLANVYKEWVSVRIYSENLAASNETCQVSYELEDIDTFTNLVDSSGTALPFTVSPYQEIPFPKNTVSKKLNLRLSLARGNTTTETPKIKKVVVEYIVRPDTRYGWQLQIRTGRKLRNSYTGRTEQRDPAEWKQLLETYRDYRMRVVLDDGDTEPGITNLITNPTFSNPTAFNSWNTVGAGAQQTVSYTTKIHGLRSFKQTSNTTGHAGKETGSLTTVVGTRYTASCYIYLESGDPVTLELRDQTAGTVIASVKQSVLTSRFVRIECTGVATSTATRVRINRRTEDATQATVYYVNAFQLEVTTDKIFTNYDRKATRYCDGSQPRCRWSGSPDASSSIRDDGYNVYVSAINISEIKRPSIMERIRGIGNETRLAISMVEVD